MLNTWDFGTPSQLKIQSIIDPDSKRGMTKISPPQLSLPYSEEVKQRCVSMFKLGYSLTQIKEFTGVESVVELRHWLKDSGIYKSAKNYSQEQKQQCLDLYLSGKTPLEIENKMKISGFVISTWIHSSGIPTKPKKAYYSDEQEKLAISMYVEGKSYSRINSATGIPPHRVNELAKQKKVKRKRQPKAGRPAVYSEEVKQTCLDLLAESKTPMQIEQLMGVSAGQIRLWQKDYIA
jgi:transposase-like protein